MRAVSIGLVALGHAVCGGGDGGGGGDPGGFGGDPGDFCSVSAECVTSFCCQTEDCGFGMCSNPCDDDFDCPGGMGCRDDVCLVLCPSRDDRECPAGFECDEHDGQFYCRGD